MMPIPILPALLLSIALVLLSCQTDKPTTANKAVASAAPQKEQSRFKAPPANFGDHWYQGKAEITSYRLEQVRYGEVHEGTAVAIFVTEDHDPQTHIKLNNPQAANEKVNVLKLNLTKKFNTGIYPYSMMLSVFNPVRVEQHGHAHRVTCSSQEWCGQTFTAIDKEEAKYRYKLYSYFENEGTVDKQLDKVWLEDELWTQLRINPANLPTGEFNIIEGAFYQRMAHSEVTVRKAQGQLIKQPDRGQAEYTLYYPYNERKLTIMFKNSFPYAITGWVETYKSRGKELTTRATKKETIMAAYWGMNSKADSTARKKLGLQP